MTKNEHYIEQLLFEIRKSTPLDDETIMELKSKIVVTSISKKSYLLQPGQIINTMNFIANGCMRSYHVDANGNEHILQLGIENWWINDLYSYLSQKPSSMFIQAIENTTLVQIKKSDLDELYLKSNSISNFFRIKIQNAYVALQERIMGKMSDDAYDRYQAFIKNYRTIEQRIPQYMVASYLGITPEFLSHLRNKHTK
jgi:CRP-like cAMP-binding protein